MDKSTLLTYQRLINDVFPGVCLYVDDSLSAEYLTLINAVGVPDERRAEFTSFLLGDFAGKLEESGLPYHAVIPYSFEEAKELPAFREDLTYANTLNSLKKWQLDYQDIPFITMENICSLGRGRDAQNFKLNDILISNWTEINISASNIYHQEVQPVYNKFVQFDNAPQTQLELNGVAA